MANTSDSSFIASLLLQPSQQPVVQSELQTRLRIGAEACDQSGQCASMPQADHQTRTKTNKIKSYFFLHNLICSLCLLASLPPTYISSISTKPRRTVAVLMTDLGAGRTPLLREVASAGITRLAVVHALAHKSYSEVTPVSENSRSK